MKNTHSLSAGLTESTVLRELRETCLLERGLHPWPGQWEDGSERENSNDSNNNNDYDISKNDN